MINHEVIPDLDYQYGYSDGINASRRSMGRVSITSNGNAIEKMTHHCIHSIRYTTIIYRQSKLLMLENKSLRLVMKLLLEDGE